MQPKRREDELMVKRLGDEVIVYDLSSDRVHALNGAAGAIFELCDGTHDVAAIAEQLAEQRAMAAPESMAIATTALEQLSHRGLLEQPVARVTGERRVSRRHLLRQIATTAVAIPVIVSLTAPWPTSANSFTSHGGPCLGNGKACAKNADCCSGFCLGGACS